jgi:hypothetical protein
MMKAMIVLLAVCVMLGMSMFVIAEDSGTMSSTDTSTAESGQMVPERSESIMPTNIAETCKIDQNLITELSDLYTQLKAATAETAPAIKEKITILAGQIRDQKMKCLPLIRPLNYTMNRTPMGVAVGVYCEVSDTDRAALADAWDSYKTAAESGNDTAIQAAKQNIVSIEQRIMNQKRQCMMERVPGLQNKTWNGTWNGSRCEIPREFYDKMEELWKRARESISNNTNITNRTLTKDDLPEELKKELVQLEERMAAFRAKCNALGVDSHIGEKDIAAYYRQKMADAMSSGDADSRIESLKELRQEIDETIKNLIQEKRKLKFAEIKDVADGIKVTPKSIEVGDSSVEDSDVEIDADIDGHNVSIEPSNDSVAIHDEDVVADADEVTIDDKGIHVKGAPVKISPKKLVEQHALGKNVDLKLDNENGKGVYIAAYATRHRFLGIFPATARQTVKVDADSGAVIDQQKPWWISLSSDVKEPGTTS